MGRRTEDGSVISHIDRRAFLAALPISCAAIFSQNAALYADGTPRNPAPNAESLDWDKARRDAFAQKELEEYDAFARQNGFQGKGRVKATSRFTIVYNASEAYAEWVAALGEEVAKGFEKFAVKLGVKKVKLSKPLSVYVFADRALFDAWDRKLSPPSEAEETRRNRPMGFYATGVDRTFVYDQTQIEAYRVEAERQDSRRQKYTQGRVKREGRAIMSRDGAAFNTETIVHELTHQMCYNYGVLRTNGRSPDWLVEGLAMVLEPCDENAALGWRYRSKLTFNTNRFRGFCAYANNKDGELGLVDELVLSDRPIQALDADAYCVSWAMVYYCCVKRAKEFAKYIEKCAKKKGFQIDADERRRDFVETLGEIDRFKAEFAKFMKTF